MNLRRESELMALLGLWERPLVGTCPERHHGAGLRHKLPLASLQLSDLSEVGRCAPERGPRWAPSPARRGPRSPPPQRSPSGPSGSAPAEAHHGCRRAHARWSTTKVSPREAMRVLRRASWAACPAGVSRKSKSVGRTGAQAPKPWSR